MNPIVPGQLTTAQDYLQDVARQRQEEYAAYVAQQKRNKYYRILKKIGKITGLAMLGVAVDAIVRHNRRVADDATGLMRAADGYKVALSSLPDPRNDVAAAKNYLKVSTHNEFEDAMNREWVSLAAQLKDQGFTYLPLTDKGRIALLRHMIATRWGNYSLTYLPGTASAPMDFVCIGLPGANLPRPDMSAVHSYFKRVAINFGHIGAALRQHPALKDSDIDVDYAGLRKKWRGVLESAKHLKHMDSDSLAEFAAEVRDFQQAVSTSTEHVEDFKAFLLKTENSLRLGGRVLPSGREDLGSLARKQIQSPFGHTVATLHTVPQSTQEKSILKLKKAKDPKSLGNYKASEVIEMLNDVLTVLSIQEKDLPTGHKDKVTTRSMVQKLEHHKDIMLAKVRQAQHLLKQAEGGVEFPAGLKFDEADPVFLRLFSDKSLADYTKITSDLITARDLYNHNLRLLRKVTEAVVYF